MFLRRYTRNKDGISHTSYALTESTRTGRSLASAVASFFVRLSLMPSLPSAAGPAQPVLAAGREIHFWRLRRNQGRRTRCSGAAVGFARELAISWRFCRCASALWTALRERPVELAID
jgi:hypothetical protein